MGIWSLLPAAASLAFTALNKPRQSEFKTDVSGLERRISNLTSRRADREVAEALTRPASRLIGAQTEKARRGQEALVARTGAGAGVEAQLALSRQQQANQALQQVGEQAGFAQIQENRRIGEQVEGIEGQIQDIRTNDKRQFDLARRQQSQNVMGQALNLGTQAVAGYFDTKEALGKEQMQLDRAESLRINKIIDQITTTTGQPMTLEKLLEYGVEKNFPNITQTAQGYIKEFQNRQLTNAQALEGVSVGEWTEALGSNKISGELYKAGIKSLGESVTKEERVAASYIYNDKYDAGDIMDLAMKSKSRDAFKSIMTMANTKYKLDTDTGTAIIRGVTADGTISDGAGGEINVNKGDIVGINNITEKVEILVDAAKIPEGSKESLAVGIRTFTELQKLQAEQLINQHFEIFTEDDHRKLDAITAELINYGINPVFLGVTTGGKKKVTGF